MAGGAQAEVYLGDVDEETAARGCVDQFLVLTSLRIITKVKKSLRVFGRALIN